MSSSSSSSSLSLSSQQQTMTTTDLPSAALDQLQWVKIVPKVSLTSSASPLSTIDHPLWWPCLLFNEYEDFQEFFEDELAIIHDDKKKQNEVALETRRLILTRIFANMLQRRPVMVARLLGRSIQDYMEVVNLSEDEDEETISRITQILESYQATDYMPFTALSSEERLRQMDPKAFAVAVSNDIATTTTIIDDELYMNYMLALDMAATQRMGGMIAPNKTLRSDFRDIARAELAKLSPSIKKLSDTSLAVVTTSNVTNINNDEPVAEVTRAADFSNDDDSDRQERIEEDPEKQNEHEDHAMDSDTQKVIDEGPEEDSENENENENDTMKSSSTVVTFSSEGSCTSPSSHGNEDGESHTTPSSKSEDEEKDKDPTICPDDALEIVQNKLELMGWTIDTHHNLYLSPKVGYDDIKRRPFDKGKDYFLDKTSFHKFLMETYGWQEEKKTPKSKATITPKKLVRGGNKSRGGNNGSTTVTPLSSKQLPKRTRRFSGDDVELLKKKRKHWSFKTEEEEDFYTFKSLIGKLVKRLDWGYKNGVGLNGAYNYILPHCKSEKQGGEWCKDFFYEEAEVIQYCVDNNYFKNRKKLGLLD
ncbi:hypothetical protein FRACYDRAFT_246624 [Fragilariopsis cylindrus CCMP1102]|uniref:Uncharacterized protein n=1 Tax=Fragilariopsis cylindrus CCMP1102 TaxID=635003 RepID=A0A1E7EY51_9STRA|nr:hypothetical protein FRACYDRAFT_246624 [Fragilariopsis cylindrus CCMP1102]|eukprot:OEU10756.1 hypothetical protein FRACYDRAFT_246624 [Fragilariopsis cylindrus CCMP1102]